MRSSAAHPAISKGHEWADVSGRCFFAWRMAAACEDALREVQQAMTGPHDPEREHALQRVRSLLRREMRRWVRRGEELDELVDHIPHPD